MHTVFALLCFVVVTHWLIFPYPSGLLHWHCGNLTIAPMPAKQPWWIWINTSFGFIMNDYITTTKQSTTKPCAYFLGYTVGVWWWQSQFVTEAWFPETLEKHRPYHAILMSIENTKVINSLWYPTGIWNVFNHDIYPSTAYAYLQYLFSNGSRGNKNNVICVTYRYERTNDLGPFSIYVQAKSTRARAEVTH